MVSSSPVIRTAVVGVGFFGALHVEKYTQLSGCKLVAVVDVDQERARAIGEAYGVPTFADCRQVIDLVDAVSVATPATLHYDLARQFLENGRHVLIEKPMATRVDEARHLIALANDRGVILQVGHQERFFAVELDLAARVGRPTDILCRRFGAFTGRGLDCNVVLDLMIHDIDLVHQLAPAPLEQVAGHGSGSRGLFEDEVDVTMNLADGCRVRFRASRVSDRRERSMRVTSNKGTMDIDLINYTLSNGVTAHSANRDNPVLRDLLGHEVASFVDSVRTGRQPLVTGEDGYRALETALRINASLQARPVPRDIPSPA